MKETINPDADGNDLKDLASGINAIIKTINTSSFIIKQAKMEEHFFKDFSCIIYKGLVWQ